ncbi:MAG: hypothetical protein RDU59_11235 [Thermodesulfobacteriota bacterium]|nr:hypothetical protein [Thermodesulfobacteriota bacterium]
MESTKKRYNDVIIEAPAKVVTPVKTGVQEYPDSLEITGFRLSPE